MQPHLDETELGFSTANGAVLVCLCTKAAFCAIAFQLSRHAVRIAIKQFLALNLRAIF